LYFGGFCTSLYHERYSRCFVFAFILSDWFLDVGFVLLSQTFVPIMANWMMKGHAKAHAKQAGHPITEDEEFQMTGLSPESEKDTLNQKKVLVEPEPKPTKLGVFDRFKARLWLFWIDYYRIANWL
jgi:hypothetical protein